MHILDKIVAHKRQEIIANRHRISLDILQQHTNMGREGNSLTEALRRDNQFGVIAEFKRKSPSQSDINIEANPMEITEGYEKAGVAGISVLTDEHFFGGSTLDFESARKSNKKPMLRKDFIIDPYQLYEAKVMGADVILLIAEILSKEEIRDLSKLAHDLGLEVLMELHDEVQMSKISTDIDIIGVNNRNLDTFEVDFNTSLKLFDALPTELLKISESGISNTATLLLLKEKGFDGFLIGQCFMETANPGLACKNMMDELNASLS